MCTHHDTRTSCHRRRATECRFAHLYSAAVSVSTPSSPAPCRNPHYPPPPSAWGCLDQTCATYVAAFQTCATYPRLLCHFAFPAMAPLPSNTCVPSQLEARERVHVHETTQFVRSVDSARCTSLIFRAIFPIRTMQHPMVFFDAVYCIFGTIGMIFNLFGTR